MADLNKGEDLYEELRKTLETEEKSEGEEPSVATDQKPTDKEKDPKQEPIKDDESDLSNEDISKLHPKAQKRIKELADKVRELAEKTAEKSPESPKEKTEISHDFKSVQEFLQAVEDKPSRNLLEKFYGVIKGEISNTLSPIEKANSKAKFNEEFSQYENIEGLLDHKTDLEKTFMRNPNQSLRALIGETMLDLQTSKVKPIEKTPSSPNRGEVDLSKLSKDELYDYLESNRQ